LIRILYFVANPTDTDALRLLAEVRDVQDQLRGGTFREQFEIRPILATRAGDITKQLQIYRPDIVHFSGHGTSEGSFVAETQDGDPQEITSAALARLFQLCREHVRVVVLNSCESAKAREISNCVDVVISMGEEISDSAAIAFAVGFYGSLANGMTVQKAFDFGKVHVGLLSPDEADIPQLISANDTSGLRLASVGDVTAKANPGDAFSSNLRLRIAKVFQGRSFALTQQDAVANLLHAMLVAHNAWEEIAPQIPPEHADGLGGVFFAFYSFEDYLAGELKMNVRLLDDLRVALPDEKSFVAGCESVILNDDHRDTKYAFLAQLAEKLAPMGIRAIQIPRLAAEFESTSASKDRHYGVRISIANAPPQITKVAYRILDESFDEPAWTTTRDQQPVFAETFRTTGDINIRATLARDVSPTKFVTFTTPLGKALVAHYPSPTSAEQLALRQILSN
jgi:hypothetical protein